MKKLLVIVFFVLAPSAFAQGNEASSFVLDHSRQYVYLKFDHIGPRKPVQSGESGIGLWLKVVNNCRIPILFKSYGVPPGEPGVGLADETVEVEEARIQIYGLFAKEAAAAKEENRLRLQAAKAERQLRLQKLKHKPEGYLLKVSGAVRVQPGEEILFSVPRNHVSNEWDLRLKFVLDVSRSKAGPYTYLYFSESDIPREFRQIGPAPLSVKPASKE
jgi:hypothetical protein